VRGLLEPVARRARPGARVWWEQSVIMSEPVTIVIHRHFLFHPDEIIVRSWPKAMDVIAANDLAFNFVEIRPSRFGAWATVHIDLTNY
jgi:hypothetical protein